MKKFLDNSQLEHMAIPTVQLPHHQMQLKRALVSAARKKQATTNRITLRGWIQTMSTPKNIITGASLAGILTLAVIAFSAITPNQMVSAQELARQTSQTVAQLTPEQSAAMSADYKKHFPYFQEWLSQAQTAPDLRVLTYDQFVAAYPEALKESPQSGEPLRVIDDPTDQDTASPDLRKLRYLEFGVTDGDAKMKMVIGINDRNIPEAALQQIVEMSKPRIGA